MSGQSNSTSSGMPPALGAPDNIDETFGAVLIGAFFSIILYGIGVHQIYRYFRVYGGDPLSIRGLVVLLSVLETLQVVFSIHASYHYLVTNYFKPTVLATAIWSANLIAITGALINVSSQAFFLRRVSLISSVYRLISVVAGLFLGVNLACNIFVSMRAFQTMRIEAFTEDKWVMPAAYGSLTIVNILVTGSLFAVMARARPTQGSHKSLADSVVIYGINSGLLVLVFDLVAMIMAAAVPNALYWFPFGLITARLYMNTLLSVLNSRKLFIARGINLFDSGTYGANILTRANRLAAVERWNVPQLPEEAPPALVDIKVTTEIEGDDNCEISPPPSERGTMIKLEPQRLA
ncbi:hypothetical protein C8Q76DRAFT_156677 [Earliella scabrosa]|nr:hypothetical protein C8Q76DRAFT_156677 [Earliella scabrosa]